MLKFVSCCSRHKMLIGESSIASNLLICLNIYKWVEIEISCSIGLLIILVIIVYKSTGLSQHLAKVVLILNTARKYTSGETVCSLHVVWLKKVFMYLCSSFSCIYSYGSTQIEL